MATGQFLSDEYWVSHENPVIKPWEIYWQSNYSDHEFDLDFVFSPVDYGRVKLNENTCSKRKFPYVFIPFWDILPSNWDDEMWNDIFGEGRWQSVFSSRYGTRIRFSGDLTEEIVNGRIHLFKVKFYI